MKHALITFLAVTLLAGCSFESVPPAHKGRMLTSDGYQGELLEPQRITVWWRQNLVLLETGTSTFKEGMGVLMSDRLRLGFDVRGRVRVNPANVEGLFNDIAPHEHRITLALVYDKYGKMLIRNKAREVMSKYSIDDVHKRYGEVSAEIYAELMEAFKGTPLTLSDVALGNIQFPEVVTKAVENEKSRQVAIGQEKAQVQIELTKKQGELELARKDREIRMLRAETIRDENQTLAESVTPAYLEFRRLEVMEKMASNGAAVFVPFEMMNNPGLQNRLFSQSQ